MATASEDYPLFPIPASGRVVIIPTGSDTFDIQCTGVNDSDQERLFGIIGRAQGCAGIFRFEHAGRVHEKCRFDSHQVPFSRYGPDNHAVTFPIKILC